MPLMAIIAMSTRISDMRAGSPLLVAQAVTWAAND
jgi:hypothetical protein